MIGLTPIKSNEWKIVQFHQLPLKLEKQSLIFTVANRSFATEQYFGCVSSRFNQVRWIILKGQLYEISTWSSHALIVHRSNLNSFDTEIQLELSTLRNTVNYKPLTNTTTGRADKKSTDESWRRNVTEKSLKQLEKERWDPFRNPRNVECRLGFGGHC